MYRMHCANFLLSLSFSVQFCITLQSKSRSLLQEKELKDSLQRVQEEAQKQLEVVNAKLQSRSGEMKEKERELGEVRLKLEGEVACLHQQLLTREDEIKAAQRTITEVYMHLQYYVHFVYLVCLVLGKNDTQ